MSFSEAYNMATQLAHFPCYQPTPLTYLTTFVPAIAPALIEFASFGCRDILKFRAGVGAPCGRLIKAQFQKAAGPSAWNAAEKIMKFEHQFSKAGFWFMIADLASDTAIRWMTLAYRMEGCSVANAQASWQYEPFVEDVLFAHTPKPIAGRITNYSGEFGHATIVGAICPSGWHFQGAFELEWRPLFGTAQPTLTLWIEVGGGGTFDFPGKTYSPGGYPWQQNQGGYQLKTQNEAQGARHYVMYAMSDIDAVVLLKNGAMSVSALPPMSLYLSPLNCWKNLFASETENPRGRNRKQKPPDYFSKSNPAVDPKPYRGRPGGMPRSKK